MMSFQLVFLVLLLSLSQGLALLVSKSRPSIHCNNNLAPRTRFARVPLQTKTRSNAWRRWDSASSTSSSIDDNIPKREKNENADLDSPSPSVLGSIMFSMLRGLTVPFPALRRVVLYPGRQNKTLSIGLSTKEGLIAVSAYLAMGVLAYHRIVERWSIVDALYFTCVCFSTVGYGDLCPTNRVSQLFTMCFGLGGIAFLGAAIATIGSSVVQAERDALSAARAQSRERLWKLFHDMPNKLIHFRKEGAEKQLETLQQAREQRQLEDQQKPITLLQNGNTAPSRWIQRSKQVFWVAMPPLLLVILGSFVLRYLEGASWSFLETLYYALITASTIGLGDFAPSTRNGRLFAVFFIPLAVAAAGEIFSSVALTFMQRRQKRIFDTELSKDLSLKHLQAMDSNGDNAVTREEYVTFMLLEMGRVDTSELKELHKQFDQLDVSKSGSLDREDLKLMAQLNGQRFVQ